MARTYYLITNVLLLLTSLCLNIAARKMNVVNSIDYADDAIIDTIDIISLEGIKIGGGPSPGGKGHEFPSADSFGNIKNSGPSPGGKGHEFTNNKILGEMKNSGRSPGGKGHGYHDAETFGNIKNSGPSSEIKISGQRGGEKSREFPTGVETLGNILNSASRWGGKGDTVTISENLWDLKNSGPSHGGEGH